MEELEQLPQTQRWESHVKNDTTALLILDCQCLDFSVREKSNLRQHQLQKPCYFIQKKNAHGLKKKNAHGQLSCDIVQRCY